MLPTHESFVVDTRNQRIAVILPMAEYRALLEQLCLLKAQTRWLPPIEKWNAELWEAMIVAGYLTSEQVAELKRMAQRA